MISAPPPRKSDYPARRPPWWAWHQRLGLGFAVVFLGVVVTGIALNHTESLSLDRKVVTADWIYDWYDISLDGEPIGFAMGSDWVVGWDGQLLWNTERLGPATQVLGAQRFDPSMILILTDELWVLSSKGELVERLGPASLPDGTPLRLGRLAGESPVVIETTAGRYRSDLELLTWIPLAAETVVAWSEPGGVPSPIRQPILRANRGEGLTFNRVILDLHSGRFFGRLGVWVVDLAAVALIFLTVSGTWYAWRIKRRT